MIVLIFADIHNVLIYITVLIVLYNNMKEYCKKINKNSIKIRTMEIKYMDVFKMLWQNAAMPWM